MSTALPPATVEATKPETTVATTASAAPVTNNVSQNAPQAGSVELNMPEPGDPGFTQYVNELLSVASSPRFKSQYGKGGPKAPAPETEYLGDTPHPEMDAQIVLDHNTQPVPEAEPVVEPESEPTPTPAEPVVEPKEDEDEPVIDPVTGKIPQVRYRPTNDFDKQALLLSKNLGIPLEQAIAEVKRIRGTVEQPKPEVPKGPTITEIDAKIAQLRKDRSEAKKAFDVDKEEALTNEIEDLLSSKPVVVQQQANQAAQAQQAHYAAFNKNRDQVMKMYPELSDLNTDSPKNAMSLEVLALDRQLQAANDPIYNSPQRPIYLAQQAAMNLTARGIPVTVNSVSSTKPVPARTPQPAKPAPPLLSGSARTTQQTAQNSAEQVLATIDKMSSEQIHQMTKAYGKLLSKAR